MTHRYIRISARYFSTGKSIVGLIGEKNISPIYFTTRLGIHTFGVCNPIDVVLLKDNTIQRTILELAPNRIFLWGWQQYTVLELPQGTVMKYKLKIQDRIELTLKNITAYSPMTK
jgi:hypothetical protein